MSINFDCKYNLNKKNTELKADVVSNLCGVGGKCFIDDDFNLNEMFSGIVFRSSNNFMDCELELLEDKNKSYLIEAKGFLNINHDLIDGKVGLKYNKYLSEYKEQNNISGVIEGGININNIQLGLNYESTINSNYIDSHDTFKQKKTCITPFLQTNSKQFKGRIGYEIENNLKINKYGSINKSENHYLNMKTNYDI